MSLFRNGPYPGDFCVGSCYQSIQRQAPSVLAIMNTGTNTLQCLIRDLEAFRWGAGDHILLLFSSPDTLTLPVLGEKPSS